MAEFACGGATSLAFALLDGPGAISVPTSPPLTNLVTQEALSLFPPYGRIQSESPWGDWKEKIGKAVVCVGLRK